MSDRFVYFIEAGKGGPIKIGVAVNVAQRLRDLQVANSTRLHLIVSVPGNHKDETRLHRRFKSEGTGGEWFKGDGAVRAFAVSLIGMTEAERVSAVGYDPTPPKQKKPKPRRNRIDWSPRDWHAMFYVGDGGDIYRSAEAEAALREMEGGPFAEARKWQDYIRRQRFNEFEDQMRGGNR